MASAAFGKRPREEGEVEEGEVAETAADAPGGNTDAFTAAVTPPSSCLKSPPSDGEGRSIPSTSAAPKRN